jgi:hypothetical protein
MPRHQGEHLFLGLNLRTECLEKMQNIVEMFAMPWMQRQATFWSQLATPHPLGTYAREILVVYRHLPLVSFSFLFLPGEEEKVIPGCPDC